MPFLTSVLAWLVRSWVGQVLIGKALGGLASLIRDWKQKRDAKKLNQEIRQVAVELGKANEIQDMETRLKVKEEKLAELQKLTNLGADPFDANDT